MPMRQLLRAFPPLRLVLLLALFFTPVQSPAQNPDSDDPAAELASFQVADGFDVHLFASEKDGVVKPIQIRFDTRGRLWVIGSTVYPQIKPGETPNDKVLILEDAQMRGRCDKVTVFADGLTIPTGLELGDGGAYVGQGTELLFLRDTRGGDHADERRVVLRGFGTGDAHQMINSFLFGPGGELWFSQGLHVRSRIETPWGIARLDQAGIWRFFPRRGKLEGFYGSEHEPQNPWGFVFTDWGEPIVLAGNNSSAIYPVPGLTTNHRDDAPALIWKGGGGRKVSGGDIVGTTQFPDSWQGALIVGGYINNAVWTLKVRDDGAGFQLEDLPPLIKSTSRSFRPVDVKFGPDGALYLCDWYNPIIGHYQASFRHPDRDKGHGRIWRVTAKGRPETKPPKIAGASIPELLEDLRSPDRWTRRFAKRALADLPGVQVISALDGWSARTDLSDHDLMEGLGVYASHEIVAARFLERLTRAREPGARAYAAAIAGIWAGRLPDALGLLRPLAVDENPRVRLQAVVACAQIPLPEAMETAAMAGDMPMDKFLAYAMNQTVYALKPFWLPALKAGTLRFDHNVARLGMLVRADGTPDTLEAVRGLLSSGRLDVADREAYQRLLAETGDENDLASILNLPDEAIKARLLPVMLATAQVRNIRPSGDVVDFIRSLMASRNADLRAGAVRLAGVWRLEALREAVEAMALDAKENEESRRAAILALGDFGGGLSIESLSHLAGEGSSRARSAAIAALSRLDLAAASRLAGASLATFQDQRAVEEVFAGFLQRKGGASQLAAALSVKTPTKPVAETGLRMMSESGRQDPQLAAVLSQAAGLGSQNRTMTREEIATFAGEVRLQGDVRKGEEIFRRPQLGCLSCHAINGKGRDIGPDLGSLGSAQPVDFIIGAILEPQKEVKEGYMSVLVTMENGDEYQGYVVRETNDELALRDVLQQKVVRLPRKQIKERRQSGSLMPSGLTDGLSRAEFRDLVRFLSELGRNH